MHMKAIQLKWVRLESQFAYGYLSEIPGINSQYSIGTDRTTGRVYLTGLDRTSKDYKTFHSSFDEAKEAAQADFEKIVNGLIELHPKHQTL